MAIDPHPPDFIPMTEEELLEWLDNPDNEIYLDPATDPRPRPEEPEGGWEIL